MTTRYFINYSDYILQCGIHTKLSHPAKYSPDDKYARYRLAENYD